MARSGKSDSQTRLKLTSPTQKFAWHSRPLSQPWYSVHVCYWTGSLQLSPDSFYTGITAKTYAAWETVPWHRANANPLEFNGLPFRPSKVSPFHAHTGHFQEGYTAVGTASYRWKLLKFIFRPKHPKLLKKVISCSSDHGILEVNFCTWVTDVQKFAGIGVFSVLHWHSTTMRTYYKLHKDTKIIWFY